MQALIIDAGNSRVRCVAWPGSDALPAKGGVAPVSALENLGEWPTPEPDQPLPSELVRLLTEKRDRPAVLVSVIPEVTAKLAETRADLRVVDHRSRLPFTTAVSEPEAVGSDRICNVAAACAAGLDDALIVDAGTATTFDLLAEGAFLGGMIAPGMAFAARRLGEEAARLAPVPFEPRDWDVGKDTRSAMSAGAWHVGVGGAESVIRGLLGRYGPRPVILTGGLGHFLGSEAGVYDPDWTLRGAAFLGL